MVFIRSSGSGRIFASNKALKRCRFLWLKNSGAAATAIKKVEALVAPLVKSASVPITAADLHAIASTQSAFQLQMQQ